MHIRHPILLLILTGIPVLLLSCGGDDDDGGATGPDPTGSIEVSLTVSGEALDPDGCVFTVDGTNQRRITSGETTTYSGLPVGPHDVAILDVAGNCQVLGAATRSVAVAEDQTATVAFAVTCAEDQGAVSVSTTTTGENLDPNGYEVVLDGGAPTAIGIAATVILQGVSVGAHSVALHDVADNCSVTGTNPRDISVPAGGTTAVTFEVECTSTTGTLRVTTSTSGEDPDVDGYQVIVDGGAPQSIAPTGSLAVGDLLPGDHTVKIEGEAFNCTLSGPRERSVTISAGEEAQVDFGIACRFHLYDRIAFTSYRTGSYVLHAVDPHEGPSSVRSLGVEGMAPAVSTDGLRIAYYHDLDIWVVDSDGTNPVNLTQSADPEAFPAWSPDGERIIYARNDDLWVMDADGSNQHSLGIKGLRPSWSPDGCCIVFQGGTLALDIVMANADGTALTTMVGDNWINEAPAWSPLGDFIAYSSDRDGSRHVFLIDRPGGVPVNMTGALIGRAVDPTWAPNAEAGAFASNAGGNWDIYYFDPDTSVLVQLTTNWNVDMEPSWGGGN